ncbi:MAG: GNAT family N-acetyltransferase, partial [Pseudomonadota bacterium]
MEIRTARPGDWEAIWSIVRDIVRRGDTYGYDPAMEEEQARSLWMDSPRATFVADDDGVLLGTYYLKTNHAGPGRHVCNCGYMVAEAARGRGLATAMCRHSQRVARELDYAAMQFNFVASSNEGAVRLWRRLGFEEVGRL